MGLPELRASSGAWAAAFFAARGSRSLSFHRRDLGGIGGAEDDSESGPSPGARTLRDERAPVRFDDRPAYRQAQAEARASFGTARSRLDEGLEDLLQLRRLEAATFVLEFDLEGICRDCSACGSSGDCEPASTSRR